MDELIQLVTQKTGLSQDVAQQVVNIVVTHLKEKLPAPLASGVDSYLSGESSDAGSIADKAQSAASGLGGMFSKTSE